MLNVILSISAGSVLGGLGRWVLSNKFNPVLAMMPLGTYLANIIAGYIIGLAVAFFSSHPTLPAEWRLFIVTGSAARYRHSRPSHSRLCRLSRPGASTTVWQKSPCMYSAPC